MPYRVVPKKRRSIVYGKLHKAGLKREEDPQTFGDALRSGGSRRPFPV